MQDNLYFTVTRYWYGSVIVPVLQLAKDNNFKFRKKCFVKFLTSKKFLFLNLLFSTVAGVCHDKFIFWYSNYQIIRRL
jgi:hypothetical protein